MRKVIGIGETVLDIIFKNGKPIEAVPGGSSFNAVISLGRAGVNTSFISEAGNDRIGEYVIEFLRENGVNADNVSIFPDSKSPLSSFPRREQQCRLHLLQGSSARPTGVCHSRNQCWRYCTLRFVLRPESCGSPSGGWLPGIRQESWSHPLLRREFPCFSSERNHEDYA